MTPYSWFFPISQIGHYGTQLVVPILYE